MSRQILSAIANQEFLLHQRPYYLGMTLAVRFLSVELGNNTSKLFDILNSYRGTVCTAYYRYEGETNGLQK